ncbi:uncharacterized protein HMPREF1541_04808 [Cyphellophora europaea CBS 101466]|uniref:DUF8035 domain-containing protein n=1 Tax=Cyphellophora europaea (strain CBS 101466) TaxID=1220924 RepID=W2RVJ5_CYPE1|nr:uncharacterized protein HMPREF1541_04808 [Cyphellophora europaea CBS 101466]ETN40531.1 hypothetical protein HMPREF1541_04808 [Cyphellophora europaea CBS 101466]
MSRRGYGSEAAFDDRRDYGSRVSRVRYDDRDYDDYRRAPPPRERERDVLVREEVRERERPREPPAFLREDYGRTEAGPVVLRARETEDYEFVQRPPRPASPEPEKKHEREEIIIRRDESEPRGPPGPRPRESREREEIIIRRREDDDVRSVAPSQRGGDREREEIIIRRRDDDDDRMSRRGPRSEIGSDDRYTRRMDPRPISHERERSRVRGRAGSESQEEIIIREEDRGRGEKQQEIIIRRTSRSNSPSSISTRGPGPAPDPPVIHAPPIHQEVITHHRHIDHGFEVALAPRRPATRPPSPPSPPRARSRSEERIEIRRTGERNGEPYNEELIIDRQDGPARGRSPRPPPPRDYYDDYPPPRPAPPPGPPAPYRPGYDRDMQEEAEYYNNVALRRGFPGEAYNGATRDWGIVDVPPGTERVRMDGQGGGAQEITWQRYNGVRRSKFFPDGRNDGHYSGELDRPPASGGQIGGRYGRQRDPTDGLWTEITKDLVVKEAIEEMGYEYEETDDFYYIISYLKYEDVARLVGLSEDIRKDRRKRAREMGWESRVAPPPALEPARPRPAIEAPPRPHWDHEDERYIEREVVYRGGRPPPPPGWRR